MNYDRSITYWGLKSVFDRCNANQDDVIDMEEFYACAAGAGGQ
jgi:hypothetical protein